MNSERDAPTIRGATFNDRPLVGTLPERGPCGRLGRDRTPRRRARDAHRKLAKAARRAGKPFPSFKTWLRTEGADG